MNSINSFFDFVIGSKDQILDLLVQHIQLTVFSIVIAVAIAIPLGILSILWCFNSQQ